MPLLLVTEVGGRKETYPVLTLDFESLDLILNVYSALIKVILLLRNSIAFGPIWKIYLKSITCIHPWFVKPLKCRPYATINCHRHSVRKCSLCCLKPKKKYIEIIPKMTFY